MPTHSGDLPPVESPSGSTPLDGTPPRTPPNGIKLPMNSFTASRFLYGSSQDISATSGTLLLGRIPKIWYVEQKRGVRRNYARKAYIKQASLGVLYSHNTRRVQQEMMHDDGKLHKMIHLYYRGGFSDDDDDDDDDDDVSLVSVQDDADERDVIDETVRMASSALGRLFKSLTFTTSRESRAEKDIDVDSVILMGPSADPLEVESLGSANEGNENTIQRLKPPSILLSTAQATDSSSFFTALEDPSLTETVPSAEPQPQSQQPTSADTLQLNGSNLLRPTSTIRSSTSTISTTPEPPRVRFGSDAESVRLTKNKSKILQLQPTPVLDPRVEKLQKHNRFTLHNFKQAATATHSKVKSDTTLKTDRKRWFKRLIKTFRVGEIIKSEKMLVLVKKSFNVTGSNFPDFTEQEPFDTRVVERWKEYIVVARSTGKLEEPITLQFYSRRNIGQVEDSSKIGLEDWEISLTRTCTVNFYNPLDRTIALLKDGLIYILRCQFPSSSVHWLTFFDTALGIRIPNVLRVEIPVINLSMSLNLDKDFYSKFLLNSQSDFLRLVYRENGYEIEGIPAVEYLGSKIKKKLNQAGYQKYVQEYEANDNILGLCWRYYDRLEWLFGETLVNLFQEKAMHLTHELEVRAIKHYPRSVQSLENTTLHEPSPIEGYLLRLTTKMGNLKRGPLKKQVFSFEYFFSNDSLLYFTSAYKSHPPLPYSDGLMDLEALSNSDMLKYIHQQLKDSVFYEHNPYKLDLNGHIEWLSPTISDEDFKKRDTFAFAEFQRRVSSISKASKVINMLDIGSVSLFNPENLASTIETANNLLWGIATEGNVLHLPKTDSYLQIIMKNGSTMVLKAPTSEVRDEWVSRLSSLHRYWRLRITQDNELVRSMKEKNLDELHIDDLTEANVSELDSRWEMKRGSTNSEVYNITGHAMYRSVLKTGYLYQKPKKHSTFKRYFVTFIPGRIILYNVYVRDYSGYIKPTTHYSKYMSIPLSSCYIYSGSLSQLDLLNRVAEEAGKASLPRVYGDGWSSCEDESSRCFTLWFGKKRAIARGSTGDNDPSNPGLFHMAGRLGVTGRSMVFLCRSRQERDLWLTSLNTDMERLGRMMGGDH